MCMCVMGQWYERARVKSLKVYLCEYKDVHYIGGEISTFESVNRR